MLNLEEITKTYISKSKSKTEALKKINLSFPSKGMHLIFGKSGSGKTTLLNILSGLDNEYEGKLIVYNQEIKSKNDLENYRKKYVGFIFQDFNLIPDLTIAQNLSVGVQFNFKKNEEKIKEILAQVGLEGYENRYPNELSGGEQQRVTIARALIKESKILVADEPTGNLDKSNSEEIYELLKEISKKILVIVVSHDEELGMKYADRVIKIQKGEIIEDTQKEEFEEKEENIATNKSKEISNKVAAKMALHHFTYKKVRTSITIFLMVISYCIISFTLSIFQYSPADAHLYIIEKQKYEYFKVCNMDYIAYEYIKNKNEDVKIMLEHCVDTKKEAEEMGLKFYESKNTREVLDDDESFYVSDAQVREWFYYGETAFIKGQEVELNFEDYKVEDMIGNRLYGDDGSIVAGIFYSPYDNLYPCWGEESGLDEIVNYTNLFYSKKIRNTNHISPSSYGISELEESFIVNNKKIYMDYYSCYTEADDDQIIIDIDGTIKHPKSNELLFNDEEDEIYISLSMYNKLFNCYYLPNYFVDSEYINGETIFTLKRQPEHLGETISIEFDNSFRKITNRINLKIKGIVLDKTLNDDYDKEIYAHRKIEKQIDKFTCTFSAWIKTNSVKNLSSFLNTLYHKHRVEVESPVSHNTSLGYKLIDFENSLSQIQLISFLLCILITIIIILLTGVLISGHVVSRKKEIGILKAMGTRNRDIYKIYIFEILFISLPICILALTISPILINYINNNLGLGYLAEKYTKYFRFIYYKWTNIPFTILSIFVVNVLGTFLPLIKINHLNVIKAIKEE